MLWLVKRGEGERWREWGQSRAAEKIKAQSGERCVERWRTSVMCSWWPSEKTRVATVVAEEKDDRRKRREVEWLKWTKWMDPWVGIAASRANSFSAQRGRYWEWWIRLLIDRLRLKIWEASEWQTSMGWPRESDGVRRVCGESEWIRANKEWSRLSDQWLIRKEKEEREREKETNSTAKS